MEENTTLKLDEEFQKEDFLLKNDNVTACILLVEKACQKYQQTIGKLDVPYSFIEFFFEELEKYSALFTNKFKSFYQNIKLLNISIEDIIKIYTSSFYSQHKGTRVYKTEKFLRFDAPVAPNFAKEMMSVTNTSASTFAESMLNFCKKIDRSDELVDTKELYEQFMIKKVVLAYDFERKLPEPKVVTPPPEEPQAEANQSTQQEPAAKHLVGNRLNENYQNSGKITKIIIPKLDLPTEYPYFGTSRINRLSHIKSFYSPAKQIVFINKRKIVAIKYSTKFIDKRKPGAKPKSKFNWDF